MADTVLIHPNRDKPASKATKSAVILLLAVDGALTLIVTFGGWSELQGAQALAVGFGVLWFVMAYFVAKWNRGVLPVASALAVLYAVTCAIAAPAWFARDEPGFASPALDPGLLGLLTTILVPLQLLLIIFAMRGFQQKWNVEVEVTRDEAERGGHEIQPLHA